MDKFPDVGPEHPDRTEVETFVKDEMGSAVLIEVLVHGVTSAFRLSDFTQPASDQAAYDERYLTLDGTQVIETGYRQPPGETLRIAFYYHYYDPNKPLLTSFGRGECPPISPMPDRLRELVPYTPVD